MLPLLILLCTSGASAWSGQGRIRMRRRIGVASSVTSVEGQERTSIEDKHRQQQLDAFMEDMARLREVRPSDPAKDMSAPLASISAGSSYTRIWTQETWDNHDAPPLRRYAKHIFRWHTSTTARRILPAVLVAGLHAGVVAYLATSNPAMRSLLAQLGASNALTAMTAPLALLLTLRTNQSISRLLESRMVWGRLIRRCGSMGGLLHEYVLPHDPAAAMEAARCVACVPWCLKGTMRGESQAAAEEVLRAAFGGASDPSRPEHEAHSAVVEFLLNQPPGRLPQALNFRIRAVIAAVAARTYAQQEGGSGGGGGGLPSALSFLVPHRELEVQLGELETVVGICNRLRGSPIPPGYNRHLSRALSLWLFTLPIAVVSSGVKGVAVVAICMILSYVLVGIDELGSEIERAFPLLPLQQMAAVSQLNIQIHMNPMGGPMPPVPSSST